MPSMMTPNEQSQFLWQLYNLTWILLTETTALSTILIRFFYAKPYSLPPQLHFFFIYNRILYIMLRSSQAGSGASSDSVQLILSNTQMPCTFTTVLFSFRLVQGILMCIFSMWLKRRVKGRPSSFTKEALRDTFSMVTYPSSNPMSRLFLSPSMYLPRCVTRTLSMIFFILYMAHLIQSPHLGPTSSDSGSLDLLAYEVRLRNHARDFILKIRRQKEAFNGNYLLLRKRQEERRLQVQLEQEKREHILKEESRANRRLQIVNKLEAKQAAQPKCRIIKPIPTQKPQKEKPIQRMKSLVPMEPAVPKSDTQSDTKRVRTQKSERRVNRGYMRGEQAWLLKEIRRKLGKLTQLNASSERPASDSPSK